MTTYQVKDWGKPHFENYKSRERDACRFVAMPNKQDGIGLMRILASPNGHALFGVWCLILQKLSRQSRPRDGWLTDDGLPNSTPWDLAELAFQWRADLSLLQAALNTFTDPRIGWMAVREINETYIGGDTFAAEVPRSAAKVPRVNAEVPRQGSEVPSEGKKEGREDSKAGSQAFGFDWRKHRPADLPRALSQTWEQIAKAHGGPVANAALQAAKRIYGATVNHGQLSAAYQAAHRDGSLDLPATLWPNPNAKPEKPVKTSGDSFPTVNLTLEELVAQGLVCDDSADGIE